MLEFNIFTIAFFLILISTLLLLQSRDWKNRLRLPPSPFALPIVGHLHLLTLPLHQSFRSISDRYGPFFILKFGSVPCVVVSTPEIAKDVLRTHELIFSNRKSAIAIEKLSYNASFAFASHGPYWKYVRKIGSKEFMGRRMIDQFLPIRTRELRYFLQLLLKKSKAGETVNLTVELLKLTNNTISQRILGIRCSGTDSQAEEVRSLVREVTEIFGEFNLSEFAPIFKTLDLQGFRKRINSLFKRYDALLEKIMMDREVKRKKIKAQITGSDIEQHQARDFLDIMLDAMEDENSEITITRNHIKGLILDLMTASTDTIAVAIEWTLAELINNPTVFEKARQEIEKVIGNNRIVQESDIDNLPYNQAVIKEALRLHPPVPLVTRRSKQDFNLRGYHIPANTIVFVNVWSIGRDPKYWENPMEFQPERFLPSSNGTDGDRTKLIDVKGQHFQLLPFGSGRRNCLGLSLAMREFPTAVAAIIQCFDLKAVTADGAKLSGKGAVDLTERPGLTSPMAHDLVCVPVARSDSLKAVLEKSETL